MSDHNVIILRGLPGAGKSSLAKLLSGGNDDVVCEADQFMVNNDGEYAFNPKALGYAHGKCIDKFKSLINKMVPTVIVSNTGTKRRDFKEYVRYAELHGYRVTITVVENYHGNHSIHDVPKETMDRMETQLMSSIQLQ